MNDTKTDKVVTLAEICEALKIEPKDARKRLRASSLKKSASGWQWQRGSSALGEAKRVIQGDTVAIAPTKKKSPAKKSAPAAQSAA